MTPCERQDVAEVCARVLAEYHEMPGLKLTLPQAGRLFGLDGILCQEVLDLLIAAGRLKTSGRLFIRADSGARAA